MAIKTCNSLSNLYNNYNRASQFEDRQEFYTQFMSQLETEIQASPLHQGIKEDALEAAGDLEKPFRDRVFEVHRCLKGQASSLTKNLSHFVLGVGKSLKEREVRIVRATVYQSLELDESSLSESEDLSYAKVMVGFMALTLVATAINGIMQMIHPK